MENKNTDAATRYNEGKPKLSYLLLGDEILKCEADVWEKGENQYEKANWLKGQDVMSAADSLLRHLQKFLNGKDIDDKSGCYHVGHIITCAKIMAHGYLTNPEKYDNRPNKYIDSIKSDSNNTISCPVIEQENEKDWIDLNHTSRCYECSSVCTNLTTQEITIPTEFEYRCGAKIKYFPNSNRQSEKNTLILKKCPKD